MTNQTQNPQTLEDILFSDRNKAYGAYALRMNAENTTRKAFIVGTSIFVASLLTSVILANVHEKEVLRSVVIETVNVKLPEPPVLEQPKPETPPPVVEHKSIEYLPPVIVEDPVEPTPPPTQDVLNATDALIGSKTVDGVVGPPEVIEEPTEKKAEPVAVEKPESNEEFISVEVQPEYPGGAKAFMQFLQKNLKYPKAAANAGVGGKVFLQFVIGREGEISKMEILKGIGFGCDQEAERVVKLMPHWIPGRQSGRAVAVRYTLPINFKLEE